MSMPAQQNSSPAAGGQIAPARHAAISIALICQSYPPVIGGSEIEAQRVCAALQKRGHTVEVMCLGGPPMPSVRNWIDPAGVPVRLFAGSLPASIRGYAYALGVAWRLLWRQRHYDVVYFLMSGLQIATALPVVYLCRKVILMKFSGSSLIRQMNHSRLGRIELAMIRRWADRIMVLNDGMMEEAAEADLEPAKILWMPNPVDTDEFRPPTPHEKQALRDQFNLPASAIVVLFVGRLAPEKELGSLIAAFSVVARNCPHSVLVLVGDGPSRSALEDQVRALGLEGRIRFAGMAAGDGVRQWLQAADIFTLVSSLEGLPVSLIEAMAAGLPAVVSDIPANAQLIEAGKQGLLGKLKDVPSLAECLNILAGDEQLRREMGGEARRRVIGIFSTAIVTTRYEQLCAELLAEKSRGARQIL